MGSLEEVYSFMHSASSTLDASLEAEPSSTTYSAQGSLPPSVRSTPRTLPGSVEASLARMESSSVAHTTLDREAARAEAEEARRHRLYEVMACMRDLRKRAERTEAMFAPLEGAATLLACCSVMLEAAVLERLEKGPREWKALLNKMFRWDGGGFWSPAAHHRLCTQLCQSHSTCFPTSTNSKREELAPFQAAEAIEVRRKTDAFTEKVERFRAFFLQRAPFATPGGELTAAQVGGQLTRPPAACIVTDAAGMVSVRPRRTNMPCSSATLQPQIFRSLRPTHCSMAFTTEQ